MARGAEFHNLSRSGIENEQTHRIYADRSDFETLCHMGIGLSIIVDGLNTYLHDEAILREIIVGRYRKLRNF